MLRNVRRITPLFRSLLVGLLIVIGGVLFTGSMIGCADENDPQTHVDRLNDPLKRTPAVKRLLQYYEDAMTEDKKDRNGPRVKALLDLVVPALADLYGKGELDSRAQGDVIAFLADSRHEAALPAILKSLQEYKPDERRAEEFDTKMGDVVRNVGEMVRAGTIKGNKEINDALFKIFKNLRANTPKAQNRGFFRMLNHVLLMISDPSWEGELITMLNKPINSAKQKFLKALKNQVYWQITAAEILGNLKSKKAVKPLIKVVLSPFKANIGTTAVNALIKIGQPAIDAGVALMNGDDTELKEYAESETVRAAEDRDEKLDKKGKKAAANAYLNNGVIIVGNIGTESCIDPMIKTIDKGDKITKSLVASELYKLPASETAKAKFREVYGEVSVTDKIPPDDYAKEALIDAAGSFFDKDLNGWLLADALELKGDKSDVQGVQATVLGMAIKAATAEQWKYVDALIKKALPPIKGKADKYYFKDAKKPKEEGPFSEKQMVAKIMALEIKGGTIRKNKEKSSFGPMNDNQNLAMALHQQQYLLAAKNGKKVLDECGADVECYMKKIIEPEANKRETAMQAQKAAYMVGLLGGPDVKMKLTNLLPKVRNSSVKGIILFVIISKSPSGDAAVEAKLKGYIDKAVESRDQAKIEETTSYKQILYRLQARKGG
jgi:hypothetical protein